MKRSRIVATLSLAGLSLGVALTGCSSSSPTPSAPKITPMSTPDVATSTPSVATPAPDVKNQLLALSDLSAGWSVDNSSDSSDSGEPQCFKSADSFKGSASAKGSVDYIDGASGLPELEEIIGYFPTNADGALAALEKVFNGCGQVTFKSGGDTFTGSMGAMSFPTLGDESKAYQLGLSTKADGLNVSAGFDIVVSRVNDEVSLLLYADLGTPDVDQFTQLADKAIGKITDKPVSSAAASASGSARPAATGS